MEKIALALPAYRSPEVLAWVVESILGQSHENFCLFIFDNGAPDAFNEVHSVLSGFSDNRINYFANNQNIGHLRNYEQCFDAVSSYPYGVVIPADMALMPNCLADLLKAAESHGSDIVYPGTIVVKRLEDASNLALQELRDPSARFGYDVEQCTSSAVVSEFFGPLNQDGEYARFGVFGSLARGELFGSISSHSSVFKFHGWEFEKSIKLASEAGKITLLRQPLFVLLADHARSPATARPKTDWTRIEPILATYQTAIELEKRGFQFDRGVGEADIQELHLNLLDRYQTVYGDHSFVALLMRAMLRLRVTNSAMLRIVFSLMVRFRSLRKRRSWWRRDAIL
jgi:glycosyltransferase involved in cell wall biosynthesis